MVKTFSNSARRQRGAVWLAVMVVLAVAAGVGGMFGSASPRILLEQVLRNADPAWGVALTPDKQELQIGRDRMGLRINTGRAGHLLVLQAGTDGRSLELIFPNDLDQETSIAVGETVLPRPNWQLDAAGPAGEGTLLAVVADQAPDMGAIRAAVARGILPELGAYGAALATWRETVPRKQSTAGEPVMIHILGKSYEMGKYHVTRGEFAKFVSEASYDTGDKCWTFEGGKVEERSGRNWRNPGYTQDDNHPVACVNWNDAQAYVSWLSKKAGKQYRLPNETEWEYACYGGSQTEYCGGGNLDTLGWYKDNSGGATHPVGQKQANGYGLYDMTGNVWEWMENKYDNEHDWRALRGGSWNYGTDGARAASRNLSAPGGRDDGNGFRVARTLP